MAGRFTGKNGLPAGDSGAGSGKELGDQLLGDVFRVFLCFNLDVVLGFFKKKNKNFGLRLSKILEFRGVALSCKHEALDLAFRAVGLFSVLFGSPLLQRCARAGGAPHTPRSKNAR